MNLQCTALLELPRRCAYRAPSFVRLGVAGNQLEIIGIADGRCHDGDDRLIAKRDRSGSWYGEQVEEGSCGAAQHMKGRTGAPSPSNRRE